MDSDWLHKRFLDPPKICAGNWMNSADTRLPRFTQHVCRRLSWILWVPGFSDPLKVCAGTSHGCWLQRDFQVPRYVQESLKNYNSTPSCHIHYKGNLAPTAEFFNKSNENLVSSSCSIENKGFLTLH